MRTRLTSAMVLLGILAAALGAAPISADPIRFAIIGDRTGDHTPGVWASILAEAELLRPEFMITVGDMIEGYTEDSTVLAEEWGELAEIIGSLATPIYFTPGNHDITTPGMLPYYRANAGEPYYSFDHRGVHIVVVDNSANWGGPSVPLADEQFDWLVEDLTTHSDAAVTLVFCHKPFHFATLGLGKEHRLHTLFVQQGVDAVFCGHFHRYFAAEYDGIKYIAIGSSGGGITEHPGELGYHFAWVTIDGGEIHVAPIAGGAVRAWDNFGVSDLLMANRIERRAISMAQPVLASEALTVPPTPITVRVENHNLSVMAEDTAVWTIPDGWTVNPASLPFVIEPGGFAELAYTISCTGELFPTPSMIVDLPLNAENECRATWTLWLGRQANSYRVDGPVTIDGRLDESFWKDPCTTLFAPEGGEALIDPVEFYFAHDSAYFYLAAICSETRPDSLRAKIVERDGPVYGEDCIGFFIAPDPTGDTVYQVYINPLGTIFDQRITWNEIDWYETDRDWDGGFEVSASLTVDGWAVEARIPIAEFGSTGITDDGWGVNFRRKQRRLGTSGDWLIPIDYAPDTYGRLQFLND